jgi:ring-1,2-phenylacetyl-CoA epoxidase subunit PaaC
MDDQARASLSEYLLGLADDKLILGHRDSEWCGHAPILEEDIAFANIALDEIGHAVLWYGLLADLNGEDRLTYPDRMVFQRPAKEFRNIQMVELPKGDWAFSILRQYLFDAAELIRLEGLKASRYPPLTETAAKIQTEEIYHRRHNSAWVKRLGLGTQESHRRLQAALNSLWEYSFQLFAQPPGCADLVKIGFVPDTHNLQTAWQDSVTTFLQGCDLAVPRTEQPPIDRRQHTTHLDVLIAEMQSVARLDPLAEW